MRVNLIIWLVLAISVMGCVDLVDHVYRIEIHNYTNDTIQFYGSYNYPDTSIDATKPRLIMATPNYFGYLDSKYEWKDVLPKDTILIYILNKDTVDGYSWETIKKEYKILKKYTLSLEDLENNDFKVSYY
jgi:hypothetical protein